MIFRKIYAPDIPLGLSGAGELLLLELVRVVVARLVHLGVPVPVIQIRLNRILINPWTRSSLKDGALKKPLKEALGGRREYALNF